MKNRLWFICLLLAITVYGFPQINCNNHTSGFTPINDLGAGFWNGKQGGIYPNGSNERPANHTAAGVTLAQNITPLDLNGNPDPVNGKIIFAGIGMSNTRLEFEVFERAVRVEENINPQLEAITTAINSHDLNIIQDSTHAYWDNLYTLLEDRGASYQQVQAIWFKQGRAWPNEADTSFTAYMDTLVAQLVSCMQIIHNRYPNCRMVYISSRIYGDYQPDDFRLNPEPFAYYNGWGVKELVERQLNGDPELAWEGPDAKAPWISWASYLWADGVNPRNDGLTWLCPDDFLDDGAHPSPVGSRKVSDYLMDFFKTDETSISWFLDDQPVAIDDPSPALIDNFEISNYPNPFNGTTVFNFTLPEASEVELSVFNLQGQKVADVVQTRYSAGNHRISWTADQLPSGVYLYTVRTNLGSETRKLVLIK